MPKVAAAIENDPHPISAIGPNENVGNAATAS